MKSVMRACCGAAILLICHGSWGQTGPLRYWVAFDGKLNAPNYSFSLSEPEAYLSERALNRRERQGISIDELDLPVAQTYIDAVEAIEGFEVVLTSKWLNAVTVRAADSTLTPDAIAALPFVTEVRSVMGWAGTPDVPVLGLRADPQVFPSEYGLGWTALDQLNGQALHALGYRGEGMYIAVLDAGFDATDRLPCFESLKQEGRLLLGKDVVLNGSNLYAHHRHGTSVLGTMAAWWPDSLIGTAPEATYVLYRTEDAYNEYLIEEDYWVHAAEHADSLGVDLINTSLGYSTFDDPGMDHSIDDLDGQTTHIARGMSCAATRGILCVTSAGNSGNSAWHQITSPADAHGILAVGAVDANGTHAPFSGFGPSADGRIKPDVMALGLGAAYPTHDTLVKTGNGTSFASPILCGLAACLWEAVPSATASEVRWAIIESAHLLAAPNDSMGHGIPDFGIARSLLLPNAVGAHLGIKLFPNPAKDQVRFELPTGAEGQANVELFALNGRLVQQTNVVLWALGTGSAGWFDLNVGDGAYVLLITDAAGTKHKDVLLVQ